MKTNTLIITTAMALAAASALKAAPFDSGSTGAYGPMNITTNTTLDIPSDGVFHCTTINVTNGATLKFRRNSLNTPVYLLAQSNVVINGTIDLSATTAVGGAPGQGGPGGFDGGYGAFSLAPGGDGKGPGGGIYSLARGAAYAQTTSYNTYVNTNTYGNALISPLIGGSGGSGGSSSSNPFGGGGGGGAILIAANGLISVNGSILCNGGSSSIAGGGSGGGIRLVAAVVSGSGQLFATGGSGNNGSRGRVRIDCEDRYAFRSLSLPSGATRGSQMFVFPSYNPRLDIIEAAGQVIPAGTTNSVSFELPPGPTTNIIVRVQATDFTNNVPIRVVVTPENGASSNYNATIDITLGNPASTNVTVTIPADTISTIHAWTR